MAANTKQFDFAVSVKQRLDFLDCSYTEEMDETSVADLLLNPGEGRLKILQWLFSRYDLKLAELLDPSQPSFGARTESRVQRLLTAASVMCLCRYDDVALIRGEGPLVKQMTFIDKLLDLVCQREKDSTCDTTTYTGPRVSPASQFMDVMVSQDGFLSMLDGQIDLLPRDVYAEIERMWNKDGWERKKAPPAPSIQELSNQSQKLSEDLSKHNSILETLQQQVSLQGEGKQAELVTMAQMLSAVIRELRQLADGFTHCYESNISQWCHMTPPQLSDLGVGFKRVHGFLLKFVTLFEDVSKMRQLQTKLTKDGRRETDGQPKVLVQASHDAAESFQRCLSVLEETLYRRDSNFMSKHRPAVHVG